MSDMLIAEKLDDGSIQSTVIESEVREFAELNELTRKNREDQEKDRTKIRKQIIDRQTQEEKAWAARMAVYRGIVVDIFTFVIVNSTMVILAYEKMIDVRVAWSVAMLTTGWISYKLGRLFGANKT